MGFFKKLFKGITNPIGMAVDAVTGIGSSIAANKANKYAVDQTNKTNLQIAQMNNEWSEKMLDKQQTYNKENFGMQTDFSREMYDKQTQNQWDMFNATNEYNSASAQRDRLEQAGLNPYMMMSGGSAGSASAVGGTSAAGASAGSVGLPSPSQVQMQAPLYDFSGVANSVHSALELNNRIADSRSQRDLLKQQVDQLRIENRYRGIKEMQSIANMIADTKNKQGQAKLQEINNRYADSLNAQEVERKILENQNLRETFNSILIQNQLNSKVLNSYDERFRMEMAEASSRIALQSAQGQLTSNQAVHEMAKIMQTKAATYGIKLNNKVLKGTSDELIRQAKETTHKLQYEVEHARNNRGADGAYGLPNILQVGAQEAGKAISSLYNSAVRSVDDARKKKVHRDRIRY